MSKLLLIKKNDYYNHSLKIYLLLTFSSSITTPKSLNSKLPFSLLVITLKKINLIYDNDLYLDY